MIDFHHLEPSKKDISISDASISKIKSESKKCILLCRNCHAEFHYMEKHKISL
jgi:predicted HNH restriction endonuclease